MLFFFAIAADGQLLLGLPKVQVLRNDKREGEKSILFAFAYSLFFFIKRYKYCNNKLSKKNGQSECRKAVVYLSELHQTFPSISAVQQYHPKPFHRALRFQLPVSFICCLSLDYASLTGH